MMVVSKVDGSLPKNDLNVLKVPLFWDWILPKHPSLLGGSCHHFHAQLARESFMAFARRGQPSDGFGVSEVILSHGSQRHHSIIYNIFQYVSI